MKPTRDQIARDYPHRVAADPTMCPVCCDDGITNDPRYGGRRSERGCEDTGPWYECRACDVWHGTADVFGAGDGEDPEELRDWTEQDARAASEERLENIRRER